MDLDLMEKCEYEEIINRMKELEKSELKKTQKDYRLLRKYDIMEICVDSIIIYAYRPGVNYGELCKPPPHNQMPIDLVWGGKGCKGPYS